MHANAASHIRTQERNSSVQLPIAMAASEDARSWPSIKESAGREEMGSSVDRPVRLNRGYPRRRPDYVHYLARHPPKPPNDPVSPRPALVPIGGVLSEGPLSDDLSATRKRKC